jgi:hypothetical protein
VGVFIPVATGCKVKGVADSGEGVSKIMSSRTSRSSWETCDSVPGDFTRVWEEEGSGKAGGIAIESRMDRLGMTDCFSFGVETSAVLINGPGVGSGGGARAVGAVCDGGTAFV